MEQKQNNILSNTNKFYLKTFAFYLFGFFIFRLVFTIVFRSELENIAFSEIIKSFLVGARTDITMIGYVFAPFFLLGNLPFVGVEFSKFHARIQKVLLFIIFGFLSFLHFLNLNFFQEYNSHLNQTLFDYLDTPKVVISMIWQEFPILTYIFLLTIFLIILGYLFNKVSKIERGKTNLFVRLISFIILAGFLFLGIRGGVNEATINWGSVYFSKNMIVNQIALNPVFHLFKSVYYDNKAKKKNLAAKIKYFEEDTQAYDFVKDMIKSKNDKFISEEFPFYKETSYSEAEKKYNVVIILMESYAAEFAGCLGGKHDLTPRFDELAKEGILFENFFSNGQRTNRGISGTFSSFPSLNTKSILKQTEGQQAIPSFGSILKKKGYSTYFIHGGDLQFDNMQGYLLSKGVENFIGEEDFDSKTFLNKWGAPDEYIFEKTIEVLDQHPNEPTMTLLLTLTNHTPFTIPEGDFERVSTGSKLDNNYNTTKYTDYALGKFMDEMRTKPYFDETIFVFLGDHSKSYHHDINFDYRVSHTPCLIYSSSLADSLKGKRVSKIASQIDLAPTILSLLNMDSFNSFFGRDVLNIEDNGYALIANNSRIGFIKDDFYWMGKIGQDGQLLKYKDFSGKDYSAEFPQIKADMKKQMFGFAQAVYSIFKKKKIAPYESK